MHSTNDVHHYSKRKNSKDISFGPLFTACQVRNHAASRTYVSLPVTPLLAHNNLAQHTTKHSFQAPTQLDRKAEKK